MVYEAGFSDSRESARRLIMAGQIYVNGQKADKPGIQYKSDCKLEMRGKKIPYVSRGGLKLEKAIKTFGISLNGNVAMDIGASTGGFTDCMLQNGAKRFILSMLVTVNSHGNFALIQELSILNAQTFDT